MFITITCVVQGLTYIRGIRDDAAQRDAEAAILKWEAEHPGECE